jgi:hypothetical protein
MYVSSQDVGEKVWCVRKESEELRIVSTIPLISPIWFQNSHSIWGLISKSAQFAFSLTASFYFPLRGNSVNQRVSADIISPFRGLQSFFLGFECTVAFPWFWVYSRQSSKRVSLNRRIPQSHGFLRRRTRYHTTEFLLPVLNVTGRASTQKDGQNKYSKWRNFPRIQRLSALKTFDRRRWPCKRYPWRLLGV